MLQLEVILSESYDEETQSFVVDSFHLELEHSLVSLSKWESEFEKPFFAEEKKTPDEVLAYVRMMVLGNPPPEIFPKLTTEHYRTINDYLKAKRTATWFNRPEQKGRQRQVVTSELIYYWLTSYNIPWEVETWHINRLFTLLEVFNEETKAANSKSSPKSGGESIASQRRALNEARKKQLGTTG